MVTVAFPGRGSARRVVVTICIVLLTGRGKVWIGGSLVSATRRLIARHRGFTAGIRRIIATARAMVCAAVTMVRRSNTHSCHAVPRLFSWCFTLVPVHGVVPGFLLCRLRMIVVWDSSRGYPWSIELLVFQLRTTCLGAFNRGSRWLCLYQKSAVVINGRILRVPDCVRPCWKLHCLALWRGCRRNSA